MSTIETWRERITPNSTLGEQLVAMQTEITELREALTEPLHITDDPDVRYLSKWLNEERTAPIDRVALAKVLAMLTHPKKLMPMTVERISELWESHKVPLFGEKVGVNPIVFARAIEAEITKGQQ